MIPEDLTTLTAEQLHDCLDDLTEYRQAYGRGRSPEAYYVKDYCKAERSRVKAELKRRGLRLTRPGDTRTYGPGQAAWQRAGIPCRPAGRQRPD